MKPKRMMFRIVVMIFIVVTAISCQSRKEVDLIVFNAKIYTVDSTFSIQEAFAVKEGAFIAMGSDKEILDRYIAKKKIDAEGKFVYPGFYDAHGHFNGLGELMDQVDLNGTKSVSEIIARIQKYEKENPGREWIIGGGWDQNTWEAKQFPVKDSLDKYFPDKPVYLSRVDYHAAWVNSKALEQASLTFVQEIEGGKIVTDKKGELTGVLIDNAMNLVGDHIPVPDEKRALKMLQKAEKALFSAGLTSIADAGVGERELDYFKKFYKNNDLSIRLYAMLSGTPNSIDRIVKTKPFEQGNLTAKSIKLFADGALGSRGAALLDRYSDDEGTEGFLLHKLEALEQMIQKLSETHWQINTHAIGDSANRVILDLYAKYGKDKKDTRWRIEHAQIIHPKDLSKFAKNKIIPSVQPTHATSDKSWASDRLGSERIKHAYPYKELLDQNGIIALGTDFPVEGYNPMATFYAAVFRKGIDENEKDGFQVENALSREEALKGMTIWAAYASFQEAKRGSIEIGKEADFVILDQDLLKAAPQEIKNTQVLQTVLGGETVYVK